MKCFTSFKCVLLDSWITQAVKGSYTGQMKVFCVSASLVCNPPTAFTNLNELFLHSMICWMNVLTQESSLMKQTSLTYWREWKKKCDPNTKAETRSKTLQKSWSGQDFIIIK